MGRIAVALIVSSWIIPISILVNRIVPEPYMDEIFHVPQAQHYCNGNFRTWDPMITTPPGLYFISLAHIASLLPGLIPLKAASSFSEACSTPLLRSTNGVLAVTCSVLLYEIITQQRPTLNHRKATFYAVILSLYPLHWFFTYLYYTDVASLTAILAAYLFSLKKNYSLSALLGALSVMIRQTNIIWVVFIACIGIIDFTQSHTQKDGLRVSERKASQTMRVNGPTTGFLRKRKFNGKHVNPQNLSSLRKIISYPIRSSGFFNEIKEIIVTSWELKWEILDNFSPFILVVVAFVAFVYWNGSIVLGAKDAHSVSPHFAQLLYFGFVFALFTAPLHFNPHQISLITRLFWKKKLLSFTAIIASFLSVHFFSIAHPYLLADNRHYPFYLWRKVINAHELMKYILVPIYVYSWFSIANLLGERQRKTWVMVFLFACAGTLIPTPLIEFRYYTIPFFIAIINCRIKDERCWILMGILYVAINLFTMFMFLYRPFSWQHETGVQRFIW